MAALTHVILNHVDTPIKWLFWTSGEILLYVTPAFLGVALDQFTLGICVMGLNIWACRQYKRRFGRGQFYAVRYWYFPHDKKRLPGIPASYIREYLG